MRTSDIAVGRSYVRNEDGSRVTVTRIREDEFGDRTIEYVFHDAGPEKSSGACSDDLFIGEFRPVDLPEDPMKLTVDLVKAFVEEIRRTAADGDDDAAAGMEERLHASVLRATAAGHALARWVAKAALATEDIRFQRHTI